MRLYVHGHKLSIDPGGDWVIADGWSEAAIQRTHGLYLRSLKNGLQLHLRRQTHHKHALTTDGLRWMLRDQKWASPPFDEETIVVGGLTVVAGTFDRVEAGDTVLEAFIADGIHLANAVMPGARAQVEAAREAALRLACSVRFEGDA